MLTEGAHTEMGRAGAVDEHVGMTPLAAGNPTITMLSGATSLTEPDPGAVVDILDALLIARYAAGLAVVPACC